MSITAFGRAAVGGALFLAMAVSAPTTAGAQTAADYNRAAAAMNFCASPAGSLSPECAKLKGQLGLGGGAASSGGGVAGVLGALANAKGGSNAGGVAGVLGALAGSASQANASTAAPGNAAAAQQAYAACVTRAGLNTSAIQACSSIIAGWSGAAAGTGDYYGQSALATHAAGANYQACVAANPSNWQSCLAAMNGGAGQQAAVAAAVNLTGAALAGYNRCLQTNPADKCAKAYGATAAAPAGAPAQGGPANTVANAAAAAQTAKQLAPTIKALGSLLGSR